MEALEKIDKEISKQLVLSKLGFLHLDYDYIMFEEFWNNPTWKDKLWKPSEFPNLTKQNAKLVFKNWVDKGDDSLFKFINVE